LSDKECVRLATATELPHSISHCSRSTARDRHFIHSLVTRIIKTNATSAVLLPDPLSPWKTATPSARPFPLRKGITVLAPNVRKFVIAISAIRRDGRPVLASGVATPRG